MARTVNSTFVPVPVSHWSTSRPVHEGSASGEYGELDIVENNNWLLAHVTPVVVKHTFRPEDQGYVNGQATSYGAADAVWSRRPVPDFAEYTIKIYATNSGTTSPADDGAVKFEMASDSSNVEIAIPGTTSLTVQTLFSADISYDDSQSLDSIEMYIKNGTAGAVRVWSVHIAPKPLTSLSAGAMTSGAIPMDSITGVQDAPLTSYHRALPTNSCESVRKARTGTLVSYADHFIRTAASQITSTSATYELVAVIPFEALPGQVELEWSLFGHRHASGSAGAVKLITSYMETQGTAGEEVTLTTSWSSPYASQQHDWADGGQDTLDCAEAAAGHIKVYLKGDGTYDAWLMGLNIWPKEPT